MTVGNFVHMGYPNGYKQANTHTHIEACRNYERVNLKRVKKANKVIKKNEKENKKKAAAAYSDFLAVYFTLGFHLTEKCWRLSCNIYENIAVQSEDMMTYKDERQRKIPNRVHLFTALGIKKKKHTTFYIS